MVKVFQENTFNFKNNIYEHQLDMLYCRTVAVQTCDADTNTCLMVRVRLMCGRTCGSR